MPRALAPPPGREKEPLVTAPVLSAQDLIERGWRPAMIRDLLGPPDREEPNALRVNRWGRQVDMSAKLYLKERVLVAEATVAFDAARNQAGQAQARVEKAARVQPLKHGAPGQQYVKAYPPTLRLPPGADSMSDQERWSHHLGELFDWEQKHSYLLEGLSRADRQRAEATVFEKHRRAVHKLYL